MPSQKIKNILITVAGCSVVAGYLGFHIAESYKEEARLEQAEAEQRQEENAAKLKQQAEDAELKARLNADVEAIAKRVKSETGLDEVLGTWGGKPVIFMTQEAWGSLSKEEQETINQYGSMGGLTSIVYVRQENGETLIERQISY